MDGSSTPGFVSGFVRHVKFPPSSFLPVRCHAWICGRWSVKRAFAPLNLIHVGFRGGRRAKGNVRSGRRGDRNWTDQRVARESNKCIPRPKQTDASVSFSLPTLCSPAHLPPSLPFAPPFRELTNASISHHRSQSVTTMGLLCATGAAPHSADDDVTPVVL